MKRRIVKAMEALNGYERQFVTRLRARYGPLVAMHPDRVLFNLYDEYAHTKHWTVDLDNFPKFLWENSK